MREAFLKRLKGAKYENIIFGIVVAFAIAGFFVWYHMTSGERILRPIQKGMSQAQVREFLGAPLRAHGSAWYYDRWWTGDAVVYFDTKGLVAALETD